MRSKLLAVAVAAGLGVVSLHVSADPAQASKKSHKTAAPAASQTTQNAEIEALKAQLEALQAKVAELESRTDAQSDINVSTGQAVEQVQKAQAASDKKVAAIDKITNNTTLSGTMFFDLSNIDQKNSDTGKTATSGTGFDVKRFYLGVTHKFNDIWSANLTTDFQYSSAVGATELFVKKAYVQGKFDDAFILRLGSYDMPWIPFVESYYGYRYVDNTLTDRLKYGNSADWGVNVGGDLAGKVLNYSVSAVNGAGYKNPSRSKGVDFEGRVGFVPFDGFVVALGGYSGHRGQETETVDAQHTAQRGDIMVAYADKNFRLGGEYFTAKNWNQVLAVPADKADGYSIWGSVALNDVWSLFARYDNAKLSKDLDSDKKDVYYNAGIEYQVTKGFRLAGVYKHEKADATVATPVPAHVQNVKTNEVGVYGEVKF
ncbi:porin [Fulvimonas soli]|jgi:hypothetical protein|uniref:Phosphate-selective porin O/P n=1 Tax=Fulvimonas soli TaxID=155197 RepID=A0A316HVP7_9GAMM|nr:porin [Fulvimonas soli]PWK85228.1 phosphate-selective porin O/P [Fulvimonas soli]TNY25200.1 porin [Fulvimonas soli]